MNMRHAALGRGILVYAILLGWTLWLAFPLYWLAIAAFKTPLAMTQYATYIPWVDFTPTVAAFQNVFGKAAGLDPRQPFTNSVMISTGAGIVALVIGSMARRTGNSCGISPCRCSHP